MSCSLINPSISSCLKKDFHIDYKIERQFTGQVSTDRDWWQCFHIIGCHINQRKVPYIPDISSSYIGSLEDKWHSPFVDGNHQLGIIWFQFCQIRLKQSQLSLSFAQKFNKKSTDKIRNATAFVSSSHIYLPSSVQTFDLDEQRGVRPIRELLSKQDGFHILVDLTKQTQGRPLFGCSRHSPHLLSCQTEHTQWVCRGSTDSMVHLYFWCKILKKGQHEKLFVRNSLGKHEKQQ